VAATTCRRAAAVLLALGALVACGDDEPGSDAASDPTTTTIGSTTTTDAPSTSTSTTIDGSAEGSDTVGELADELAVTEEGHTGLEQLTLELLVLPSELAEQSFTDSGYVPSEGPNACGVDVDATHPPSVLVGTGMVDGEGRSIVEELRVYADVDAAAAAFEEHRTALACGTDLAGATFGPAVDVNDVVGADAASEVVLTNEDAQGVVIVALVGDATVAVATTLPGGATAVLDPREVAAFAVGKVLAALEAA
jgi:hypothetical protein